MRLQITEKRMFVATGWLMVASLSGFTDSATARETPMPRQLLLETVPMADTIGDEKIRAAAQWKLVRPLIRMELVDKAYIQALKLRKTNPHTCILSLSTIAKDAVKREDSEFALKALQSAVNVCQEAGGKYSYLVVRLCLRIELPESEAIKIAEALPASQQSRAFGEIRDELARTGEVDKAYEVARKYLPKQSLIHQHRQIGYSCASVKHYDYHATHDYIGQTISIIKKMPQGKERDFVISQLVSNLLYATGKDKVSTEELELAAKWAEEINDEAVRGSARGRVLQHRIIGASVIELEKMLDQSEVREEKTTMLADLFGKLLAEGRIEEADRLLPRKILAIKEQPQPEMLSAFGRFNDQTAIETQIWTHERLVVGALIKAGMKDEARKRIDAMPSLQGYPPRVLFSKMTNIRQKFLLKLEDYDALKALYETEHPDQMDAYWMMMSAHWLEKGELDKSLEFIAPILKKTSEEAFPQATTNYFSVSLHENLAVALVKEGRASDALRILAQIPENESVLHAFEAYGRAVVQAGGDDGLDGNLEKLPHHAAKVYARFGALSALASDDGAREDGAR